MQVESISITCLSSRKVFMFLACLNFVTYVLKLLIYIGLALYYLVGVNCKEMSKPLSVMLNWALG